MSRKEDRAARAYDVQLMIDEAKHDALIKLGVSVGDVVPLKHGLDHRVPSSKPDTWFDEGEWHYTDCPGPFTVMQVRAEGSNTSGNNKSPIIKASALAHLACDKCGRNAAVSVTFNTWNLSRYGLWDYSVEPDPTLPREQ